MKFKAVILVFLILFSAVLPIQAATDEGYGEDETSLGQFVDSFEDLDNVSVAINVIRNSALNAIELSESVQTFENISTFTEVDVVGNKIRLNESTAEWVNQIRNEDTRAWKDYGVSFFDDFYIEFKIGMTDVEAGDGSSNAFGLPIALHNSAGDFNNIFAGTALMIYASQQGAVDDTYEYWLYARKGGGTTDVDMSAVLSTGVFWGIFNRTGIDVDALFFTDFNRTILSFKLSITAWTDDLRYLSLAVSRNAAGDPNDSSSGFIQNMTFDVPGGFISEGYFSTVDYLSDPDANGSALVSMINSSVPANTAISLEFSVDNSTWVFNDWDPLFGGFESVDLRDLNYSAGFYFRYNLSTTDSSVTPRVYQSRLITTLGAIGAGIPGQNVTGEWVEYRASAINASVGVVDGGDLNSTFEIDGDTFNVSEVVGAPGMLLSVNFTGIDPDAECVWITIWYLYDGNLNHVFEIEMWNFTSSVWVDDGLLVDTAVFVWANSTIYALRIPNEFLSGGELRVQLNHETPGNINHDLFIDYIRLIAKVPSDVEAAEPFQFFWIVIAIALMIVGIVLARMWPEEGDP